MIPLETPLALRGHICKNQLYHTLNIRRDKAHTNNCRPRLRLCHWESLEASRWEYKSLLCKRMYILVAKKRQLTEIVMLIQQAPVQSLNKMSFRDRNCLMACSEKGRRRRKYTSGIKLHKWFYLKKVKMVLLD